MREYRRKETTERPRLRLTRGADGRLYSAGTGDINDIWAEQKRIRLAEAIADDKRRTEKKQRRKEKLQSLFRKRNRTPQGAGQAPGTPREIVLNIGLPKLPLPSLRRLRLPRLRRKYVLIGGGAAVLVLGSLGYGLLQNGNPAAQKDVLEQSTAQQAPSYGTVLPGNKSIGDLGGWVRVSPPDKEPVFAYLDTVDSVQLNVSQQPLPDKFKKDTAGELAKLAGQFGANNKLTVDNLDFYVGTSAKGPQSALLVKDGLLILIKSSSALTDEQWVAYIMSLH